MNDIILGLIVFVLCFAVRIFMYNVGKHKKGKKKKKEVISEMMYLINRFKLDKKKVDTFGMALLISLMDAFIISTTFVLVIMITDNVPLELVLGLVIALALIVMVYEVVGRMLVKKGFGKDEL